MKPSVATAGDGAAQQLPGLRLQVASMADETWRHRGNTDLYSRLRRAEVVKLHPENDHVWECQLLDQGGAKSTKKCLTMEKPKSIPSWSKSGFTELWNHSVMLIFWNLNKSMLQLHLNWLNGSCCSSAH